MQLSRSIGFSDAEDIRVYVHETVRQHERFERWQGKEEILDEIESHLMEKANGMFRWVSCQLDALEKCPDRNSLRQTLRSLPRTLDETYARVISKIPSEVEQTARRLLQSLVFSERPLRIEEAVDMIALVIEDRPRFDADNRMPKPCEISSYCSSLVAVITRVDKDGKSEVKELQLAHFSVKEYLLSDRVEKTISGAFRQTLARASITEICLAYLLELNYSLSPARLRQSYPLARYAAQYWMSHAVQADTSRVDTLIREFCQNKHSSKMFYQLYDPDRPWDPEPGRFGINNTPLLYYVAYGGVICAVEEMLNNGADANAQGGAFGNALQAASFKGHNDIVQTLLDNGADAAIATKYRRTALHTASSNGHVSALRLFLQSMLDTSCVGVDCKTSQCSRKAFSSSAEGKHEPAVKRPSSAHHINLSQCDTGGQTLPNSVLSDVKDHWGSTPLSLAARKGHVEVVRLLLATNTVDPNSRDQFDRTPIWWARRRGHREIAQLLLENGKQRGLLLADSQIAAEVDTRPHGSFKTYCDICTFGISESHCYHCLVCDGGDFDVCLDCFTLGGRCPEDVHELALRKT
ncbi:ankyrin [Colletotrichum falcatum]|nr:ankyrin [Colletotrichum falcatum]